jgi:hypothetical protein
MGSSARNLSDDGRRRQRLVVLDRRRCIWTAPTPPAHRRRDVHARHAGCSAGCTAAPATGQPKRRELMARHLIFVRTLPAIALGALLAASPAAAAPGDAFGGDDTGCAANTRTGANCAKAALSYLGKLRKAALICQLKQEDLAYKTGEGQEGFSNAEENCELGPSTTSAKNKFDARIAALVGKGCDSTMLANVLARGATIVADASTAGSLDAMNASFFCDATSGSTIEPEGDDGLGWIPATPQNQKCSVAVAKSWIKLSGYADKCHVKLAASVYSNRVFDEEACENLYLSRYNAYVGKLVQIGYCPPCLADPPGAAGIGTSTLDEADAQLGEAYICPGP